MIGKRVMPCLLLNAGGLYKTVRFQDPQYVGDPINAIRIFNDKEVDEMIVLDIGAAVSDTIDFGLIADFASECFMPLCYGGGIRSIEDMRRLFAVGIEKISLNSAAVETPTLVSAAADEFGSQSITVSLDIRGHRRRGPGVFIRGGRVRVPGTPLDYARRAVALGAGEILFTSVDREGTRTGYDLDLVAQFAAEINVPVVANGGAGELRHMRQAFEAGASAVAAGSLFVFQGTHRAVLITYPSQEEQKSVFYP